MRRQRLSRIPRSSWPVLVLLVTLLVPLFLAPASGAEGSLSGIKICLDPGHGGSDPGAVNDAYGLYESRINLDVSKALEALLAADGADVVMTRYDDATYLTNRDRYTFCNDEQADLLISVHTNSVENPDWDGSMTLYFHDDDKVLAQAIHTVLYPYLWEDAPDRDAFDDWGLSKFASGVLLKSDMPAAIMEPLFMSNELEAPLLVQQVFDGDGVSPGCPGYSCRRGQIVQAIYQGILHYCASTPEPTPTPTPEPGGTMYVAAIDMSYQKKGPNVFVYTEVTIHDGEGNPVPGADVKIETTGPESKVEATETTGEEGMAPFSLRSRTPGSYTSTVTLVEKAGWTYDASDNIETSESVIVEEP